MGTKANPEPKYDCLAKAHPDEPVFVLLGRDPVATHVISFWRTLREAIGDEDTDKLVNAFKIEAAMRAWAESHGKSEQVARSDAAYAKILASK